MKLPHLSLILSSEVAQLVCFSESFLNKVFKDCSEYAIAMLQKKEGFIRKWCMVFLLLSIIVEIL